MQLFLLLKLELAIIHQATDRRFGIGNQFHQIEAQFFSLGLGLLQRHDAFLLAILTDQPDFRRGYFLVQTALFVVCDWGFSR